VDVKEKNTRYLLTSVRRDLEKTVIRKSSITQLGRLTTAPN